MRLSPLLVLLGVSAGCIPSYSSPDCGQDTDTGLCVCEHDNDWVGEGETCHDGQGTRVGDGLLDFELLDQNSEAVPLCQFEGLVTVIDISTIWCTPCQALAEELEHTVTDYQDQGFAYVTILAQDLNGDTVEEEELDFWAEEFEITSSPLLRDPDETWLEAAVPSDVTYPMLLVLDRELTVARIPDETNDAALRAAIEAVLAEGR